MIVLYPSSATDFTTNGLLVLDKYCMSATISEELNGDYRLDIELTNADNAYKNEIKADMILRAPAPVREAPQLAALSTHKIYITNTKARLRAKASSSGKTLQTLKSGTKVVYVKTSNNGLYYQVTTMSGRLGWVLVSQCAYWGEDVSTADGYRVTPEQSSDQLFRIMSVTHTLDGVQVMARHISYDLQGNFVRDLNMPNTSGATALASVLDACEVEHEFDGYSDVTAVQSIDASRKNPIDVFFADDGFAKYGGEFLRDNYNIYYLQAIGRNRGASIAYRKNLTGFGLEVNITGVITRILPIGYDKKGKPIYIDGVYVDSAHIGDYAQPKIKELDCKDVKVGDDYANAAAVKAELAARAAAEFAKGIDLPSVSAAVDFVDLDDADIKALRTIYLGDEITIKHDDYGFDLRADVVSYVWDCLRGEYESIELGDRQVALSNVRVNPNLIPQNAITNDMLSPQSVKDTQVDLPSLVPVVLPTELPDTPFIGQHYTDPTDNVLKRWDGTQWVQVGPSATQFTALSGAVTTNTTHIAQTNTAVSLKASSETVNAQGERISAAEAAITAIPGQISLAVSNSKVGTNLVPLTSVYISGGHIDDIRGQQFYTLSPVFAQLNNAGVSYGELAFGDVVLIPGETYTLSFWAAWWRESGGTRSGELHFAMTNAGADIDVYDYQMGFDGVDLWDDVPYAGGGYKRYTFAFTLPTAPATGWQVRFVVFSQSDPTHWYHISDVKIEQGDRATQWTPHTYDPAKSLIIGSDYLFNSDGLRINQYLPGNTSVPFYTHITATDFAVKRASDNVAIMQAGADDDGNGYVAVNQLRDVSIAGGSHIKVLGQDVLPGENIGDSIGLGFYNPSRSGVLAKIWYESAEEDATGLFLSMNDDSYIALKRTGGIATMSVFKTEINASNDVEIVGNLATAYETFIKLSKNKSSDPRIITKGTIRPDGSGVDSLGLASNRYYRLYSTLAPDVPSDERLKKHITSMVDSMALIRALKPIEYLLNFEPDGAPLHMGFGARQLRDALAGVGKGARAVLDESDPDHLALAYEELIAPLVGAVQELDARIGALAARLESLERMV